MLTYTKIVAISIENLHIGSFIGNLVDDLKYSENM